MKYRKWACRITYPIDCVMQLLHYKWIRDPIKCMINRSLFITHHSSSASLLSEIEPLPPKNYQRPWHTWPGWCAYSLHITKNMFSTQHLPTELRMNLEQINWGVMFAHLWFCVALQHLVHSPCPSCPRPPPHLFWVSPAPHRSDYRDMKAVVTSYKFIWNYPAKMDTDIFNIYLIVGTSKGSNVSSSFKSIGTEIRPKDKKN